MEDMVICEAFVKEVSEMLLAIQDLLKQGLIPLKAQVYHTIIYRLTDKKQLDRLLSDLLEYTQIAEGLDVFKRLCKYTFRFYPHMTIEYINLYRDMYDPDNVMS